MSELLALVPYMLLGIALGSFITALLRVTIFKPKRDYSWTYDVTPVTAPPRPKRVDMFCVDCGKTMVSMRSQDGFDPKTGVPVYGYERACPAATNPSNVNYSWPACGNRTKQTAVANAHNHPDPDATTLDCPVCVDMMLENAAIDPKQAIELYLKNGVASTPPQMAREYPGGGSVIPTSLGAIFGAYSGSAPTPTVPPARGSKIHIRPKT